MHVWSAPHSAGINVPPLWIAFAATPSVGGGFHLSDAMALPFGAFAVVVEMLVVVFNARVAPVPNRLVVNRKATSATKLALGSRRSPMRDIRTCMR